MYSLTKIVESYFKYSNRSELASQLLISETKSHILV